MFELGDIDDEDLMLASLTELPAINTKSIQQLEGTVNKRPKLTDQIDHGKMQAAGARKFAFKSKAQNMVKDGDSNLSVFVNHKDKMFNKPFTISSGMCVGPAKSPIATSLITSCGLRPVQSGATIPQKSSYNNIVTGNSSSKRENNSIMGSSVMHAVRTLSAKTSSETFASDAIPSTDIRNPKAHSGVATEGTPILQDKNGCLLKTHLATSRTPTALSPWDTIAAETPSRPISSKKIRRKFPGPAGALPELGTVSDIECVKLERSKSPDVASIIKDVALSQADYFNAGAWVAMLDDLDIDHSILDKYNINNLLKLACRKQLNGGKVPLLCVLLDTISIHAAEATATFKDPTGCIMGTIHRYLVRDYLPQLQPGAALLLTRVGVFSPTSRTHYLNVTPNNLLHIYSSSANGTAGCVVIPKKIRIKDLVKQEVMISCGDEQQSSCVTGDKGQVVSPVKENNVSDTINQIQTNSVTNTNIKGQNKAVYVLKQTLSQVNMKENVTIRSSCSLKQMKPLVYLSKNSNTTTDNKHDECRSSTGFSCYASNMGSSCDNSVTSNVARNITKSICLAPRGKTDKFQFKKATPRTNPQSLVHNAQQINANCDVIRQATFAAEDKWLCDDLDDILSELGEESFM